MTRPHTANPTDTLILYLNCPADKSAVLIEWLWAHSLTHTNWLDAVEEVYNQDEVIVGLRLFTRNNDVLDVFNADFLAEERFITDCQITEVKTLQEQDWAESWKAFWHPTRIHDHLVVCPSWEPVTPAHSGDIVLTLDPGCAFGTGAHETTRLMLQALHRFHQTMPLTTLNVLDVGTGSGILAIYAALLGSPRVTGIDNDPVAMPAAQENCTLNGVTDRVSVSTQGLDDLGSTTYPLILANIIAPVLIDLMPQMVSLLAPGGTLMMSGLIEKSIGSVEATATQAGLTVVVREQLGDWFSLEVRKP